MFETRFTEYAFDKCCKFASSYPVFLRLGTLFCVFQLSACIPVSSSPFVYPLDTSSTLEQDCIPVVLIVDKTKSERLLGFQFVLGVFPLTRLYSLESPVILVEKELTTYLRELGYCVIRTTAEYARQVQSSLQARYVLSLSDVSLSATAYDLLFVRRLSVNGALNLGVLRDGQSAPVNLQLDFSEGEFARSGFSHRLVALLQLSLRKAFRESLNILFVDFSRRDKLCASNFPGIFIAAPELSPQVKNLYPKLEGDFRTGLAELGWETEIQSRVISGYLKALESEPVVWSDSSSWQRGCAQWRLSSDIERMSLDGQTLEVSILFGLNAGDTSLTTARCQAKRTLDERHRDVALLGLGPIVSELLTEFYYPRGENQLAVQEIKCKTLDNQ